MEHAKNDSDLNMLEMHYLEFCSERPIQLRLPLATGQLKGLVVHKGRNVQLMTSRTKPLPQSSSWWMATARQTPLPVHSRRGPVVKCSQGPIRMTTC